MSVSIHIYPNREDSKDTNTVMATFFYPLGPSAQRRTTVGRKVYAYMYYHDSYHYAFYDGDDVYYACHSFHDYDNFALP